MSNNKEFIGWVSVKDVEHNGNSWQYTQISFKVDDLEKMKGFVNDKGYINLKLNRSQKGKEYLEIDTFGIQQQQQTQEAPTFEPPADTPPAQPHNPPLAEDLDF